MKALLIKGYGDIESNLSFEEIKKPTCGKKQILVGNLFCWSKPN